jgi:hypothetical protein
VIGRQSGERRDDEQDMSHERKKTREEGILLRCGLWTRAREKARKRGGIEMMQQQAPVAAHVIREEAVTK